LAPWRQVSTKAGAKQLSIHIHNLKKHGEGRGGSLSTTFGRGTRGHCKSSWKKRFGGFVRLCEKRRRGSEGTGSLKQIKPSLNNGEGSGGRSTEKGAHGLERRRGGGGGTRGNSILKKKIWRSKKQKKSRYSRQGERKRIERRFRHRKRVGPYRWKEHTKAENKRPTQSTKGT